jgi:hypothetical protein
MNPRAKSVGPVPPPGGRTIAADDMVAPGDMSSAADTGSGDPAYNATPPAKSVGPVPSPGRYTIAVDSSIAPSAQSPIRNIRLTAPANVETVIWQSENSRPGNFAEKLNQAAAV